MSGGYQCEAIIDRRQGLRCESTRVKGFEQEGLIRWLCARHGQSYLACPKDALLCEHPVAAIARRWDLAVNAAQCEVNLKQTELTNALEKLAQAREEQASARAHLERLRSETAASLSPTEAQPV